jgi:hypothetical protein
MTKAIWECDATGAKRFSVGETALLFESGEVLKDGDYECYHRKVENT